MHVITCVCVCVRVCVTQANNAYIFPAVGMAAVLSRASFLGDEAFLVAAMALAELTDPKQVRADTCM